MQEGLNVEEYETDFLQKYLKKKAEKKILQLTNKIESLDNEVEIKTMLLEIDSIKEDLEKSLEQLKPSETKEEKTKIIEFQINKYESDNYLATYKKQLKNQIKEYCDDNNIEIEDFEEYIFSNATIVGDSRIPDFIYSKLFDFQRASIKWLDSIYKKNKGGVLADEMGLGKTLQIIAFISGLFLKNKVRNVLIIAPTTVLEHWVSEWKKFYPFIRVIVFHRQKSSNLEELFNSYVETGGVFILSYDGLKRNFNYVCAINFGFVVLDEGHKIKNRESMFSQFSKLLECKKRIVISGTPLQNNLAELWNLMDFVNPGLLGDYATFKTEFEERIRRAGYKQANSLDVKQGEELSKYLKSIIAPFILRRTKKEVARQLPKKTEKIYFCSLTEEQENLYLNTLKTGDIFDVLTGKRNALFGIDLLRKICNHCFLMKKDPVYLQDDLIMQSSGKMIVLNSLLKTFQEEQSKVLLFTQTIGMMDILERYCKNNKLNYIKMNGKTPLKERSDLVNRFNSQKEIFLFLLTTRVGGLGLNLVGASRVIIYDPDWNPSTDAQARERVYRYGQSKDVQIYKLITAGTIEEKILQTQIFKNLLYQKVFHDSTLSKFFNKLDFDSLFSYTKDFKNKNRIEEVEYKDIELGEVFSESEDVLEEFITKRESEFNNDQDTEEDSEIVD